MGDEMDQMNVAIEALEWLDVNNVLMTNGYERKQLLPIGISREREERTLFCITTPAAPRAGVILWFSEVLIQSFLDFNDYFLAMCDYNRLEVKRLMEERGPGNAESTS